VFVVSGIQDAVRIRRIDICVLPGPQHFSTLLYKRKIFFKKKEKKERKERKKKERLLNIKRIF
jgi:hypothetical protein